jgi:hypothetical protein
MMATFPPATASGAVGPREARKFFMEVVAGAEALG